MDINEYNRIKKEIEKFKYTSMTYEPFEGLQDFSVITETPDIIALYGDSDIDSVGCLQWATNDLSVLMREMEKHPRPFLLGFVPKEWHAELVSKGFEEYGVMRDYWLKDLTSVSGLENTCDTLKASEAEAASNVTLSCMYESREFRGETPEWIVEWISNREPNAVDCNSDCTVLCIHEGNDLAGIACIATYNGSTPGKVILWVRELAVSREYQHRGYGRRLLRSALRYGQEHGATCAYLSADELNKNALALYKSEGFEGNDDLQIDLIAR